MSGKSPSYSSTKGLLRLLSRLGSSLNTTLNIAEIQKQIVEAVISINNIDAVCIYVYNETLEKVTLENSAGFSKDECKSIKKTMFSDEILDLVRNGRFLYSEFPPIRKYPSLAVIPCIYLGVTLGSIILGSKKKNAFDEEIRLVCEAIAARTASILKRIRNEEYLKKINRELGIVNSRLLASEERFRAVVEDQTDLICRFKPKGTITFVNDSFCRYFALEKDRAINSAFILKVHPEDREKFSAHLLSFKPSKPVANIEYRVILGDGTERWIEWTDRAVFIGDRKITEFQAVGRDITDRKYLEERLKHMSMHDALTELYNRAFFDDQMKRYSDPRVLPVGIIVVDINALKIVNDALGHQHGDTLIISAANVLRSCFRSSDTIARIGGDEFGILLPNTDSKTTISIIDRIKKTVQEERLSNPDVPISLSIGYSIREKRSTAMEEVFAEADDRMYKEKEGQRDFTRGLVLTSLVREIERIDLYRAEHMTRVRDYCMTLAEEISLSMNESKKLSLSARYHDIGMIGVDKKYLSEKGTLSPEDSESVRHHVDIGSRIADAHPFLNDISFIIHHHHERWDGSGYPSSLVGEDIPLLSRIITICDSFDAMTCNNRYRQPFAPLDAADEIEKNSGLQFDPVLASAFSRLVKGGAILVQSKI
jgi:diguanylate cyclase (GGDEF)-like protein/PAS domain S-box-containing protein